tara:strand:+ start:94 stop:867 length:774 start_codon:yes stop_codon:yes gene_type:complete
MPKKDNTELKRTIAKSIFGIIPYVGTAFDEIVFEHGARIKQNRLNNFVAILADGFTDEKEINLENIKNEDFIELFESVVKRAVRTKSESKLLRFKNILVRELKEPTEEIELTELYLDLITTLSEDEIIILHHHRHFDLIYEEKITGLNKLRDKENEIAQNKKKETIIIDKSKYEDADVEVKKKIGEIEEWLGTLRQFRTAEFYRLEDNRFMLFKQRLLAQGLLVDNRMNRISGGNFQNMGITEFGLEFLTFIEENRK